MPGSLDFNGMLSSLGGRTRPVPQHPLDDLAAAARIAQDRLRVFDPGAGDARPTAALPPGPRPEH